MAHNEIQELYEGQDHRTKVNITGSQYIAKGPPYGFENLPLVSIEMWSRMLDSMLIYRKFQILKGPPYGFELVIMIGIYSTINSKHFSFKNIGSKTNSSLSKWPPKFD
jgi:hypothetical protein